MSAININDLNNAQLDVNTIASVATSTAATVTDRLGNTKNTLSGFNAALLASSASLQASVTASNASILASATAVQGSIGYLPPVVYAAGISLTLAAQTVGYSGQTYAPLSSALPFTTSGTFETAKFRLVQGVAGADLAAPGGAGMINGQAPFGVSAIYRTIQDGLRDSLNVRQFGAIGDGVSRPLSSKFSTLAIAQVVYPHALALTDELDWAAIQAAINFGAGNYQIRVNAGTYLLNRSLKASVANTSVLGEFNNFNYGNGPAGALFKWTGFPVGDTRKVCVDTYVNPTDPNNIAYVSFENIAINGNGLANVGYDGGFLTRLTNVSIVGNLVAGLRICALGQASTYRNCAFNSNYDGVLALGDTATTQVFTSSITRQNTRFGVNGPFPASNFHSHIFESNGGSGVNLTGQVNNLSFSGTTYFEQNDAALGANGYQVRSAITGGDAIVFDGSVFGSTGLTKVAKVDSGRMQFRNCSQTGDINTPQVTVAAGAEVTLYRSFTQSQVSAGCKIIPEVVVDRDKALRINSGNVIINSPAMIFGAGDFAVAAILELSTVAQSLRPVIYGNAGAFYILLSGSATGMTAVNLVLSGSAPFRTTTVNLRANTPNCLVYSRVGGIGALYLNGVQIDVFPDANNYSVTQSRIGFDETQSFQGSFYSFATWVGVGITPQQVFDLWREGGNARAAGLTPTFDIDFTLRVAGRVFNRPGGQTLAMNANTAWVSPQVAPGWQSVAVAAGALNLSSVQGAGALVDFAQNITAITMPSTPIDGQLLRVMFANGGTFTVAGWPASVALAGGAFTLTAVAGKRDTLSFAYEAIAGRWYEQARSQNT